MSNPLIAGPCEPWPLDTTCLPDSWVPGSLTPNQTMSLDIATEILWGLTQGRFGLCTTILRPCRKKCVTKDFAWSEGGTFIPVIWEGNWYNIPCGCRDTCGCGPICEIKLPGPVHAITEILLDGVIVNPATYRVDNQRSLVRVGTECWPECQRMELPTTEVGTFSIEYQRGIPVPKAGIRAVTTYAIELAKACDGDTRCLLPERTQTVTREGLTMSMIDPMDFIDKGLTGLRDVDMWIRTVNPSARRDVSRVYSPDLQKFRRQTWP